MFSERLEKKRFIVACKKISRKSTGSSKEQYESFLRKKKRKSVKQSEIIAYRPKTFDTVDIKSDITENSKTLQKLSKTIKMVKSRFFI